MEICLLDHRMTKEQGDKVSKSIKFWLVRASGDHQDLWTMHWVLKVKYFKNYNLFQSENLKHSCPQ